MKSAAYLVSLSNRIFTTPVLASHPSAGSVDSTHFGRNWLYQKPSWGTRPNPVYQLADRLHDKHVARVRAARSRRPYRHGWRSWAPGVHSLRSSPARCRIVIGQQPMPLAKLFLLMYPSPAEVSPRGLGIERVQQFPVPLCDNRPPYFQ